MRIDPNNPIMAYILGVKMGDGWITYSKRWRDYYIGLNTISKSFANEFAMSLKSVGLNPHFYGPYIRKSTRFPNGYLSNRQPFYDVRCHSKNFCEWFLQMKFDSNTTEVYLNSTEKIRLFLKGFYESEGSICPQHKNSFYITLYNSDKNLLELIGRLMLKSGYSPAPKIYKDIRNMTYRLRLNKNVPAFLNWINPCIKGLMI